MSTRDAATQYVIGVFDTYARVEQTIRYLAGESFAVEQLAVVARRLRVVSGRDPAPAWPAVPALGMGALAGALLGLALGLSGRSRSAGSAVLLTCFGCLLGATVGPGAGGAMSVRRRRRMRNGGLAASRYEVLADNIDAAREAARLMVEQAGRQRDVDEARPYPTAAEGGPSGERSGTGPTVWRRRPRDGPATDTAP